MLLKLFILEPINLRSFAAFKKFLNKNFFISKTSSFEAFINILMFWIYKNAQKSLAFPLFILTKLRFVAYQ